MKSKNKIGLILCSLVTLICLGTFTQAASVRKTLAYTYIRAANPDSFSGLNDALWISGINGAEMISFVQYRYTHDIRDYSKARLGISFSNDTILPDDFIVEVINCSESELDLDNLTWNNAPSPLGVKIGEFNLSVSDFSPTTLPPYRVLKYVDVTPSSGSEYYGTFVLLTHAEVTLVLSGYTYDPHIIFTVPDDAIPSYNLFIVLGILGVLSILLYKKLQIKHK